MIPFLFCQYLQDVFDCPLVIQLTGKDIAGSRLCLTGHYEERSINGENNIVSGELTYYFNRELQ